MPASKLVIAVVFCLQLGCSAGQQYRHFSTVTPISSSDVLVIGFLGGRQPWNSRSEGVRKLALELRSLAIPSMHVETVENKKRHLALELIRKALDADRNGSLSSDEKRSARLIVYGQSFGGAAVIKIARQLNDLNIPVLLTVQIDSVGRHDHIVPSNVRAAANLYQKNGLIIKGEPRITAANPGKTKILGNFEFDYSKKQIDISQVRWWKKIFRNAHTKMNFDADVWKQVRDLILAEVVLNERRHADVIQWTPQKQPGPNP